MKYILTFLIAVLFLTGFSQHYRPDILVPVNKTSGSTATKALEAKFTADVTQGKAPLVVQFTDQSTGNPISWKWYFGDGDSSLVRNPVHTYITPGIYSVKLLISDGANGFALEKKDYIRVNQNFLNCDTLRFPLPEPLTYYIIPNKGYLAGNNIYGDKAVCDYFDNMKPNLVITGLICEFSKAKQVAGLNEKLNIHVWNPSVSVGSPGQIIGTDTLLLSTAVNDVKNNKITTVDFNAPLQPGGSFFIGLTLPKITGDTLSFWSTQTGKVAKNTTWIQQSNDTWSSVEALYSPAGGPAFLISSAIYPKVCMINAVNELKPKPFAIWPNPATDKIIIVNQEKTGHKTNYSIYNISGAELHKGTLNSTLSTSIDVSKFKPGIYIIQFSGTDFTFTERFIVR